MVNIVTYFISCYSKGSLTFQVFIFFRDKFITLQEIFLLNTYIMYIKFYIFLTLLLINTATIGSEDNIPTLTPSQDDKDLIYSILNKNIFQPVLGGELTVKESRERIANTKNKLRGIIKDKPTWLEFIILDDFQKKDKYDIDHDIRLMMTDLLFELDKTGSGLFRLASNEKSLAAVIKLSYNDWSSTREPAKKALQKIIDKIGNSRAIMVLLDKEIKGSVLNNARNLIENSSNEFIRRWALETYFSAKDYVPEQQENIEFLVKLLKDKSWYVQTLVIKQLIKIGSNATLFLEKHLKDNTQTISSKYLAAYSLLRIGADISEAMNSIKNIKIPMPAYISQEMRNIIVQSWVPSAEPRTDVRWLIEYELLKRSNSHLHNIKHYDSGVSVLDYPDDPDIQAKINKLINYLQNKGMKVELIDYAEEMGSGSSTVYLIKMEFDDIEISKSGSEKIVTKRADWLHISKLAPYIYHRRYEETTVEDDIESGSIGATSDKVNQKNYKYYREAAKKYGFTWLSDEQLEYKVPALNIYFFGNREPLSVQDLLFYWQD